MKIDTPCLTCFCRQAEKILNKFEPSRIRRIQLMKQILSFSHEFDPDAYPLELSPYVYDFLGSALGIADLYAEEKQWTNTQALRLEPFLSETVEKSEDPLKTALKLSIIGNILDYTVEGIGTLNLENFILKFLDQPLLFDESKTFFQNLKSKKQLVFLTDNSGEIIFDRVFLNRLKKEYSHLDLVIGGKERPILNDLTAVELKNLDFEKLGKVLSTGSTLPGNVEKYFSKEFLPYWENPETVVLAKGQGNFEGLRESSRPVFFAFMAKCPFLAETLHVPEKSLIFRTAF